MLGGRVSLRRLARAGRWPGSVSQVSLPWRQRGYSGDAVTQRRDDFAIFDARVVCHTSILLEIDPDKNEISRRTSSRKESVVVVKCRAKRRTYSTDVLTVLVTCMVSCRQQVLKFNIPLLRLPFDYLYSSNFITKALPHYFKPDESVTLQSWVRHHHLPSVCV